MKFCLLYRLAAFIKYQETSENSHSRRMPQNCVHFTTIHWSNRTLHNLLFLSTLSACVSWQIASATRQLRMEESQKWKMAANAKNYEFASWGLSMRPTRCDRFNWNILHLDKCGKTAPQRAYERAYVFTAVNCEAADATCVHFNGRAHINHSGFCFLFAAWRHGRTDTNKAVNEQYGEFGSLGLIRDRDCFWCLLTMWIIALMTV